MSKEKLYKKFFGMGMAFLKLSFAAWLDERKAKDMLKEYRFFTMLEKIVEHGKPQYTDEVTFHGKTLKFKERLEQALTEQDEATKKRIQQALKGSVGNYKKNEPTKRRRSFQEKIKQFEKKKKGNDSKKGA